MLIHYNLTSGVIYAQIKTPIMHRVYFSTWVTSLLLSMNWLDQTYFQADSKWKTNKKHDQLHFSVEL